jgi:NAD-dependent dihydropyrimidine dehydrogenase PreA subunit
MVNTLEEIPGVEWVKGTGDFIKIDEKKCIGCMNCVKVCLAGCFETTEQRVRVKSLEKCMECASCWYVCEAQAIIFSWPLGGTGFHSDWG